MNDALTRGYNYLLTDEGIAGIMTIPVLALACVVMLTCMISYPEVASAVALAD